MLLESADLIIQMYADRDMMISRLAAREKERFGSRIEPGGDMHRIHLNFIEWASLYDGGGPGMRSAQAEALWLKGAKCPVVRIDGGMSLDDEIIEVERVLRRAGL
jgi:hypothetical protein